MNGANVKEAVKGAAANKQELPSLLDAFNEVSGAPAKPGADSAPAANVATMEKQPTEARPNDLGAFDYKEQGNTKLSEQQEKRLRAALENAKGEDVRSITIEVSGGRDDLETKDRLHEIKRFAEKFTGRSVEVKRLGFESTEAYEAQTLYPAVLITRKVDLEESRTPKESAAAAETGKGEDKKQKEPMEFRGTLKPLVFGEDVRTLNAEQTADLKKALAGFKGKDPVSADLELAGGKEGGPRTEERREALRKAVQEILGVPVTARFVEYAPNESGWNTIAPTITVTSLEEPKGLTTGSSQDRKSLGGAFRKIGEGISDFAGSTGDFLATNGIRPYLGWVPKKEHGSVAVGIEKTLGPRAELRAGVRSLPGDIEFVETGASFTVVPEKEYGPNGVRLAMKAGVYGDFAQKDDPSAFGIEAGVTATLRKKNGAPIADFSVVGHYGKKVGVAEDVLAEDPKADRDARITGRVAFRFGK